MIEYQVRVYDNGKQEWFLNGKLHREDGPAIVDGNIQEWWLNGNRHREDGPAIINGKYRAWYLNGKWHREDGPAIIGDGYQEWYLNGEGLSEADFLKRTQLAQELTVAEISELLGYEVKIVK